MEQINARLLEWKPVQQPEKLNNDSPDIDPEKRMNNSPTTEKGDSVLTDVTNTKSKFEETATDNIVTNDDA